MDELKERVALLEAVIAASPELSAIYDKMIEKKELEIPGEDDFYIEDL
jgi:hypothetical protein